MYKCSRLELIIIFFKCNNIKSILVLNKNRLALNSL